MVAGMFLAHVKQYSPLQPQDGCWSCDVPGAPQHVEAQRVSKGDHLLLCAGSPQGLDIFIISKIFNLVGNV